MTFYLKFDLFDKRTLDEGFSNNFKDLKIICTAFGRNSLWVGDDQGIVYKFDQEFSPTMFIGYAKIVSHIYQCKEKDVLITAGIDEGVNDVVKVWNLSKWNKQNNPTVLRVITSYQAGADFKITCLNVLNDLSALVLGLDNGSIDLIYSDILLPKRSKRKQLYSLSDKVTTVAINQINNLLYIFATTESRLFILSFNEQTNDIKISLDTEDVGCPPYCSLLIDEVFTVANYKGIYDVYLETMGPCRALDGEKINLYLHKNYLIIVKVIKPSVLAGAVIAKRNDRRQGTVNYQVVIFDHVNKFIADEFTVPDYNFLFVEWNSIYVYCGEPTNKIIVLTEKDLQSKMKIFFQKNSFTLAIRIAKSQNFDDDDLANMFRQYGDHLYKEKNYNEAIDAYIKTIGKLEPSFVIGKYLNMSQIPYLTYYMEALMQETDCKAEYVVLLINCYIILKEQSKLLLFIKNHKKTQFDIDKIMNLLHKVQFYDEALELAKRYQRNDWYLKIMIEDLEKYDESIDYISKLSFKETEEALLTYGDTLIHAEPEILAQQLERVCDKQSDSNISIATILKVFVNNRKGLKHFLQSYISKIISIEENHSVYVDTLLELLLFEVEKEPDNSQKSADEVMQILQSDKLMFHKSKALIICQNRGFTKGYRYLCELQKNYIEILQSYYQENDFEGILSTCQRFGAVSSELWIKAFEYLIKINADEKYLIEVINEIETLGLISPLQLLEKMTAQSHSFDFGLIKDFTMRYYERNEDLIQHYQNEISKLKEETQKNNDIVRGLDTEIQVFQNLKCMVCSNTLDIPSVHFLCGHSYHMRCFETYKHSNEECPNCAPNNDHLLAEINQWQSGKMVSLTSSTSLSLERLWYNVLNTARHPISIDPDQFISDSLTQSLVFQSDTTFESKQHTISNPVTREINIPEKKNLTKEHLQSSSASSLKSYDSVHNKDNTKDIQANKPMTISQQRLTSNSSPKINKPPKMHTNSNPFEIVIPTRPGNIQLKNPFEVSSVKNSPHSSLGNPNMESINPFEEHMAKKDYYPDSLNPFE